MCSGIYIIQSISNPAKIYVGSAINIQQRIKRHLSELQANKHHNAKLSNHVSKYSINDLQFTVFHRCAPGQLINREQYFIDMLNPFFNINPVAGSRLGAKHSNQSKLLISRQSKKSPKEKIYRRYARQMKIKT